MPPKTIAEEVWLLVQQWYFSRGKRVPSDEEKVCKDDIAKEAKERMENEAFMTRNLLKDELELETDYTKKADILRGIAACDAILKHTALDVKPEKATYGSSSFWKEHWEKKKANGWVPKGKSKAKVA
jgi:hypothetical protein